MNSTERGLIGTYKKHFFDKTGKYITCYVSDDLESVLKFTTNIDVDKMIDLICEYCDWNRRETCSKKRTDELVFRRSMMYYIAMNNGASLVKCGKAMGNRDHTTVIHGLKTFQDRLDTEHYVVVLLKDVLLYLSTRYSKKLSIN